MIAELAQHQELARRSAFEAYKQCAMAQQQRDGLSGRQTGRTLHGGIPEYLGASPQIFSGKELTFCQELQKETDEWLNL